MHSETPRDIIDNYKIVKSVPHNTFHNLYIAYKITSPNNPLYILKLYKSQQGYIQQKYVFEAFPMFKNYFVQSCDSKKLNEKFIQYTVSNYSKSESIFDLGCLIGPFPLLAVKYYMHSLLSSLKQIHNDKKILYRNLHPSDVIISQSKHLFVVGWSKQGDSISQAKLIYDCAQIMYFMITNRAFQEKGIGFKDNQKNRFIKQQFWDTSKKKTYSRFFPTDPNQFKILVQFMKKITIESEAQKQTLQSLLQDEYFKQLPTFQTASSLLTKKELERRSKQKQKNLKQFETKRKVAEIKNMPEQCSKRCSGYQVIHGVMIFDTQEQTIKENQQMQQKTEQIFTRKELLNMLQGFFITKLSNCLDNTQLFDEDWIKLVDFETKIKSNDPKTPIFQLTCLIQVKQAEEFIPNDQTIIFDITLELSEPKQNSSCIKNYKLAVQQPICQILLSKFQRYITQNMMELFQYKCH